MSIKIYTVNNPTVSQEEVDAISVNKFKEMSKTNGETLSVKNFITKVLKEGWDNTKVVAKVVEEKEIQSINYIEFTKREVDTIKRIGFTNAEDALGIITLKTSKAKLKVAKYYGGVYCLTYYDMEEDLLDSILFNRFDELCEELKFFKKDEVDEQNDYGIEYSVSYMADDSNNFKMLSDEVPDVMEN